MNDVNINNVREMKANHLKNGSRGTSWKAAKRTAPMTNPLIRR